MDAESLRRKGWSHAEIAHASHIELMHPSTTRDRAHLWMLVVLLSLGSIGAGLALAPVGAFLPLALTAGLALIFGLIIGGLLTHSLGTLQIVRSHHVRASMILAAGSFLLLLITLTILSPRMASFPGGHQLQPVIVSIPYVFGLITPYITNRRIHGST